jgi:hypothetical protein
LKPGRNTHKEGLSLTPRESNHYPERTILLCILVVAPFLLTPWVHGDGIGSVAALRSAVVDGDLDLANELDYLSTHIEADAGGIPGALLEKSDHSPGLAPPYHTPPPDPVTGRVPLLFTVGPPIVWAPAYLAAHGAVSLGRALGADLRGDGYGGLYYLAIALTSLACGIAGLILAFRLARALTPAGEAMWAALSMAWASPLLYYLYLAPSYCHSLTTLTSGAFFLYWWKNRGAADLGVWFKWGLLAGLLFLARWNDGVLAVPVFVAEIIRYLRSEGGSRGDRNVKGLALRLAVAFVGFLIIASIQLAAWQYFHGRPFVRYPVSSIGFWWEGLWGTFVSSRHGLFVWTPVTVPAVIGLIRLVGRNRELGYVSISAIVLLAASNCTIFDWWGGASFGMRRLISATPILVLGLAVFLDDTRLALARRRLTGAGKVPAGAPPLRARIVAPVVCLAFSVWNVLLLAQYGLGMISHVDPVSFGTIASNQPEVLERIIRILKDLLT